MVNAGVVRFGCETGGGDCLFQFSVVSVDEEPVAVFSDVDSDVEVSTDELLFDEASEG